MAMAMVKPTAPGMSQLDSLDGHVSPYDQWDLPQIEDYYRQNPGAAPNGTGKTGLLPDDAQGYSDLLNLRSKYLTLKNGQAPTVRYAGSTSLPSMVNNNPALLALENASNADYPTVPRRKS